MGHHATGTVFWGYDLGMLLADDYTTFLGPSWLEEKTRDQDVVLAEALGVDPADYGACLKAAREHPVELAYYGHTDGDTLYRVTVRASEVDATYECVRLDDFTVPPRWHEQLARFMDLMQLPIPDTPPGWFLTSDYG